MSSGMLLDSPIIADAFIEKSQNILVRMLLCNRVHLIWRLSSVC
jgi:hypothetical protein